MFASLNQPHVYGRAAEAVGLIKDCVGLLVCFGVAGLLGLKAAGQMHRNDVHWQWSLTALVALGLISVVGLGSVVPFGGGLALAMCVALYWGRRWQQMEEMSGSECAQIARGRITPGWMLRRLVLRAERHSASESHQPHEYKRGLVHALAVLCVTVIVHLVRGPDGEMIFLGYDRQNKRVYVPMQHIFLVGATGAGKTTTIRRILEVVAEIQRSMRDAVGVVIVDGKSDRDLMLAAKRYAEAVGRRFYYWSADGSLRYNFLIHGTSGELVDRILATEDFSDDYYLRIAQRFLGFVVRALIAAGKEVTLKAICEYILPKDLETLGGLVNRRNPGAWDAFEEAIPDVDARELQAIKGIQHRIAVLAESEIGPLLESGGEGEVLNLLEAVRNGDIVYFDLNANAHRETAKMLGAMIVMDLVTVFAVLQKCRETRRTMLFADDVEGYASEPVIEGIVGLFARVRSAGGMMVLGTQTFGDIQVGRSKTRLEQVLGSVRTRIIHAVPGPESAEIASRSLGDHEEWQVTEQVQAGLGGWKAGGTATRKSNRVRNVLASELMSLEDGEAVVHVRGQGAPVLTNVCMPVW